MLTLIEAGKQSTDLIKQGVIEIYARTSDILRVLPFEGISGGAYTYNQEKTLPGIGFRGVNQSYSESTGIINPLVERLVIAGGDLDVDTALVKMNGEKIRSTQEAMKTKSLALSWTETFIKGDQQSDPRYFDGLQVRVTGSQLINAGTTSGGDALSLAKLDEAIDAVQDPTHIIMNKTMKRLMSVAARTSTVGGNITYTSDEFGRQVMKYNDIPFLLVDKDNENNEIMDFDEAAYTGSSVCTSIYVVSIGPGMLFGIENGGIEVRDLGELQETPAYRTRVEWLNGIAIEHPRAAARIRYIKNAAIVA